MKRLGQQTEVVCRRSPVEVNRIVLFSPRDSSDLCCWVHFFFDCVIDEEGTKNIPRLGASRLHGMSMNESPFLEFHQNGCSSRTNF